MKNGITDLDVNICYLRLRRTGKNPDLMVLVRFGFFTFMGSIRVLRILALSILVRFGYAISKI